MQSLGFFGGGGVGGQAGFILGAIETTEELLSRVGESHLASSASV